MIIILDYVFAMLHTHIQTHSATRLLQRAYLAELRAKVRRLAVASLSTPTPQIPLRARPVLGGRTFCPHICDGG